jgi:hypothetical protein
MIDVRICTSVVPSSVNVDAGAEIITGAAEMLTVSTRVEMRMVSTREVANGPEAVTVSLCY